MTVKGKGKALAIAASLLLTSSTFAAKQNLPFTHLKPIKCYGVNSCRGKGLCGTKTHHACAGQNACKGKGWIYLSPQECKNRGGSL